MSDNTPTTTPKPGEPATPTSESTETESKETTTVETESTESDPKLSQLEKENQALKAEREELESKLGEARKEAQSERKKRQKTAREQGDHESVVSELEADLNTATEKLATTTEALAAAEAELKQYRDRDEIRRTQLLSEFPGADQERYRDAERWPLAEIEHLHRTYIAAGSNGRPQTREQTGGASGRSGPETLRERLAARMTTSGG